ncbi:MAG: hypothetical protein AAF223_14240, partial [Bacteroidota bacterium]
MLRTEKIFEHYCRTNQFAQGFQDITNSLPSKQGQWTEDHCWEAVIAFRLAFLYQTPYELQAYFAQFSPIIKRQKEPLRFEVDLMEASIAYLRGYHLRTYRLLTKLDRKVADFYQPEEGKISEMEHWAELSLLARMNNLAGKCLHRDSDHTLARI